jgi:oligopeptidase B
MLEPFLHKKNHKLVTHGHERIDHYHHIRSKSNQIKKHINNENKYSLTRFAPYKRLHKQVKDELSLYEKLDDVSLPVLDSSKQYWYYERHYFDKEYIIHCRVKADDTDHIPMIPVLMQLNNEEVILDENEEAEQFDYYHVEDIDTNPNGTLVSIIQDTDGSENFILLIKNISTNEILASFQACQMEWISNDTILYCKIDEKQRPYQVWHYMIGGNHTLLIEEKDELFSLSISKTRNEKSIIIQSQSTTTSATYSFTFTDKITIDKLESYQKDIVSHWDQCTINGTDYWVRITNHNAKENKIQLYDSEVKTWIDLVPHHDQYISNMVLYTYGLVWTERVDSKLVAFFAPWKPNGNFTNLIPFARQMKSNVTPATIHTSDSLHQDSPMFRISITSMVDPTIIMDIDFRTEQTIIRKKEHVPYYNKSNYETKLLWVPSYDGVNIPVSILYKKDIRLPCPLVLKGYGSYGVCDDNEFSSMRLPLLDRGVMIAIAHVRGSGECGKWWYEMGKLDKKINTFYDFRSVAHYLFRKGITTSDLLAIRGGSAGGLLMGAVMNMEPTLCKAVIAEVPFVDSLTTMLDASLPLSIGEREEWGDPQDPYYYKIMLQYSPYDNIKSNTRYPNVYVTTGMNDPRVGFWEPAKWVLKIRDAHPLNKIYLHCSDSGHAGGSSITDKINEEATSIVFLVTELFL